jgi:hypothetical protein
VRAFKKVWANLDALRSEFPADRGH